MKRRAINAADAPEPIGGYAQATEVTGARRLLYISGQIPVAKDGSIPKSFQDQCRLAWSNIEAQLRAADMSLDNLVKVTTFLSDRRYGMENRVVRQDVLGDRRLSSTVVIAGIFDDAWLLEIDAVAAA
jgi:2-iminobutanoate/2-iminopropanoate deaminase